MDNVVVPKPENFSPEPDVAAFIVSSDGFKDLSEMDIVGLADWDTALFECMVLIHEIGSLVQFPGIELLNFIIESLDICDILAFKMGFIHFPVELMIFHELVEVELVGTEVVWENLKIGHAPQLGLVGNLLADEGAEVFDDAWAGEWAGGQLLKKDVGHVVINVLFEWDDPGKL